MRQTKIEVVLSVNGYTTDFESRKRHRHAFRLSIELCSMQNTTDFWYGPAKLSWFAVASGKFL